MEPAASPVIKRVSVWHLIILLWAPLVFSATFSRLYSREVFLFFSDPAVDDECYFEHLNVWFSGDTYGRELSLTCRSPKNFRGMGAAILWSPGYLLFKWGGDSLKRTLGFTFLDSLAWLRLGAATMNYFIALGVLFLAYAILLRTISPFLSVLFSLILVFGQLLPYYLFRRPLMSHAAEALYFLTAVYGIERLEPEKPSRGLLILIGLALGGLLATRLQDIGVVGVILLFLAYDLRNQWQSLGWILASVLIAFTPQFYVNQLNFGHWLTPSSAIIPFMTPTFNFELGFPQLKRLFHLFLGKDWGLFWMFPWLVFLFFMRKEQLQLLYRGTSKGWIVGSFLSVIVMLNYKAHGASYGQRYVSLWILVLGLMASMGFERLQQGRWKQWAYAVLGFSVLMSLVHFVAFESDSHDLTLRVETIAQEGPVRPEWTEYSPTDWVNGTYSKNIYALCLHPKQLLQTFGAAPVPLYCAHKLHLPAAESYIVKHQIDFPSTARYYLFILGMTVVCGAVGAGFLRRLLSHNE